MIVDTQCNSIFTIIRSFKRSQIVIVHLKDENEIVYFFPIINPTKDFSGINKASIEDDQLSVSQIIYYMVLWRQLYQAIFVFWESPQF